MPPRGTTPSIDFRNQYYHLLVLLHLLMSFNVRTTSLMIPRWVSKLIFISPVKLVSSDLPQSQHQQKILICVSILILHRLHHGFYTLNGIVSLIVVRSYWRKGQFPLNKTPHSGQEFNKKHSQID